MNVLDGLYLKAQIKARMLKDEIKEFFTEEQGISNVVSMILLLLIVVIVVGIFWDKLSEWLSGMMNEIFGSDVPSSGDMSVN